MPDETQESNEALLAMTADIVSAFVGHNNVAAADVPALIMTVSRSLSALGKGEAKPEAKALAPAVPVKKSVTPDYIISLEDGKKFKSMKRYLRTSHDMSPDDYRAKWGLPADYPMVAPNYARARSELAKTMGLGQKAKGRARAAAMGLSSSKRSAPRKK